MAEENLRVSSLELNMAQIGGDIKYIKKSLDENKSEHREILNKIETWKNEAEKKFAPKWVADFAKFIIVALGAGFIGAVLKIVLI